MDEKTSLIKEDFVPPTFTEKIRVCLVPFGIIAAICLIIGVRDQDRVLLRYNSGIFIGRMSKDRGWNDV